MIKFGIFGSDSEAVRLIPGLKATKGIELVEDLQKDSLPADIEALYITYAGIESVTFLKSCLKDFKHIFLNRADELSFEDFQHLLKIAEESNVRFYPDFGSSSGFLKKSMGKYLHADVHFIEVKQKIYGHGLLRNGSCLKALLLQNIDVVLSITRANVRKVTVNIWPVQIEDGGIVHVNLEFDNGSIANITILNSQPENIHQIDIYGQSENVSLVLKDSSMKFVIDNFSTSKQVLLSKELSESTYLAMNMASFIDSLGGMLPGLIDIDTKYDAVRICNVVYSKLINNFPGIFKH